MHKTLHLLLWHLLLHSHWIGIIVDWMRHKFETFVYFFFHNAPQQNVFLSILEINTCSVYVQYWDYICHMILRKTLMQSTRLLHPLSLPHRLFFSTVILTMAAIVINMPSHGRVTPFSVLPHSQGLNCSLPAEAKAAEAAASSTQVTLPPTRVYLPDVSWTFSLSVTHFLVGWLSGWFKPVKLIFNEVAFTAVCTFKICFEPLETTIILLFIHIENIWRLFPCAFLSTWA